jgi:uncharacterized membrane protein YdbT with pleckstrin-like domain
MNNQEPDYDQPVAYDAEGRPLYAHPPVTPASSPQPNAPQSSQTSRQATSTSGDDDLHEASRAQYPSLNLSEGEYVIEEIRRHPIGLVPIVGTAGLVVIAGLGLLLFYPMLAHTASVPAFNTVILPISMIILLAILLAYAAVTIYNSNRFYLTNESVIEEIQTSLFARKERTVGLTSIEEVTFRQDTIFQNLFGYGTVQMTIEGHTIYKFPYIGNPKQRVDLLVNTIEKAKRSHPGHQH